MKLARPIFNKPKRLFGITDAALMELIEGVARRTLSASEAARIQAESEQSADLLSLEYGGTAKAIELVPQEPLAVFFKEIASDSELLDDIRADYQALVEHTRDWHRTFRATEVEHVRAEYGEEAAATYEGQTTRVLQRLESWWTNALTILDGAHPSLTDDWKGA